MPAPPAVRYFDALAPEYGRRYGAGGNLWHRYFFGARRRIALRWLAEVAGGVVADVGSGPGPLTAALRSRGCRVVAFDRAVAMLGEARGAGAAPVCADALALPLREGACDAAVALGLSSYVDDLAALLTALRRVVRPGGVVVVSVGVRTAPDWLLRRVLRRPATAAGVRGVLTSGVALRTHARREWRAAATAADLELEQEHAHDFTLFPLSRLLPGPSVALGHAVEALGARRLAPLAGEVVLRLRVPGGPVRETRRRVRKPRVVRAIARLNVGGPAINALLLADGLAPEFETTLVTGDVGPGEVEAESLLRAAGTVPERVPGLGRTPSVWRDAGAFLRLLSVLRRVRPDVVHTHTAKAGALGRVAARVAGVPHVVHTFHGHVFHGYFGPLGAAAVVCAERFLARLTDRVLAVSSEVAEDVIERYRVARREQVRVVRIGLPLEQAGSAAGRRAAIRAELGLPADAQVALLLGRLVPVKEPHVALAAFALARERVPGAQLLVAGGGELLEPLRARHDEGVHWLGWRDDVPELLAASDVALLSSRNEGTPVALIEAAAAGLPAVATRVGGVATVVLDGETGLLAPAGDAAALGSALAELLGDDDRRRRLGDRAREHVLARWSAERLLRDVAELYRELLRTAAPQNSQASAAK